MSQIALPLPRKGSGDPDRIVTGNANYDVIEALRNPASWPFKTAVLSGEARSGKSLLGRWFETQGAGAVIDGADALDETELFHRWNRAQEDGQPLLLISGADGWEVELADLRSRLGSALSLQIVTPDDEMLASLIESIAIQHGLALGEGALTYLIPRAERSFAEIERLVLTINRLSLERKAPATLGIWRDALEAIQGPEQGRLL